MLPERLREAQDWLNRAERDLAVAEELISGSRVFPDAAVYHAQQAAEKALKAFLAARDRPFPRTHDLEVLVGWCQEEDSYFDRFREAARVLTPYAVQFRYPGGPLEPQIEEAKEAARHARRIVQHVRQGLAAEGAPGSEA